MKRTLFSALAVASLLTGASVTSHAALLSTLNGVFGRVNVGESDGAGVPDVSGAYFVDILDGSSLGVLAVSTQEAPQFFEMPETSRSVWNAVYISKVDWDAGANIGVIVNTSNLGTGLFEDYFTTQGDVGAYVYYNNDGNDITEADDQDQATDWADDNNAEFYIRVTPATDFVVTDSAGSIVDQSAQVVPEPSTGILVSVASIGFLLRRRKNA